MGVTELRRVKQFEEENGRLKRLGALYYTQKLVRGRTLRVAIGGCGSLKERLGLLPNFLSVCQAVAYAHGRGVIHRDLKPENVMVGHQGQAVQKIVPPHRVQAMI